MEFYGAYYKQTCKTCGELTHGCVMPFMKDDTKTHCWNCGTKFEESDLEYVNPYDDVILGWTALWKKIFK